MAQVQARKDKIVKGLTGGIELLFKKNKIDWIKGSGRLAGGGKVEVTDGQTADADRRASRSSSPPDRSRAACPGIEIDRKRIITSDEAIGLKEVPKSIVDHGQRRRRRRVRVDLPPLRQRGDDHRAAAAAGADRGRGGVGGARAVVQEAGHQGADRHEGHERQGRRATASSSRRRRPTARRRSSAPSTCSWRPAAAR